MKNCEPIAARDVLTIAKIHLELVEDIVSKEKAPMVGEDGDVKELHHCTPQRDLRGGVEKDEIGGSNSKYPLDGGLLGPLAPPSDAEGCIPVEVRITHQCDGGAAIPYVVTNLHLGSIIF